MKILTNRFAIVLLLVSAVGYVLSGCNATNTTKGGAIGAGVGGAIGGALVGRQMDKHAEELQRDLAGAHVERVGEGILITFESGMVFDTESYSLKNETKANLDKLASTLKKYDDTNILIEGHTDDTGED